VDPNGYCWILAKGEKADFFGFEIRKNPRKSEEIQKNPKIPKNLIAIFHSE
jgi:hypothetical protein